MLKKSKILVSAAILTTLFAACGEDSNGTSYKKEVVSEKEGLELANGKTAVCDDESEGAIAESAKNEYRKCKDGEWVKVSKIEAMKADEIIGQVEDSEDEDSSSDSKSSSSRKSSLSDDDEDNDEKDGESSSDDNESGDEKNDSSAKSSASKPASSSSKAVVEVPSEAGSCAPNSASIEKGGSVVWKYTPPSGTSLTTIASLANKYFTWTFEDGKPTNSKGTGVSASSTYTTSGTKRASVTFDYRTGESETVECSPLEVKGASVTGCTCAAVVESVDLNGSNSVKASWAVSGCTSADPTFTYVWDDNSGDDVYTATATKTGELAGPSVTVKNGDNGMQEVTCPAVKVVDSMNPEYYWKITSEESDGYHIKISNGVDESYYGNEVAITLTKSESCITIVSNYSNPYYTPPQTRLVCEAQNRDYTESTITITAGTEIYESSQTLYNRLEADLPAPDKITSPLEVCVSFTNSPSVICALQL